MQSSLAAVKYTTIISTNKIKGEHFLIRNTLYIRLYGSSEKLVSG